MKILSYFEQLVNTTATTIPDESFPVTLQAEKERMLVALQKVMDAPDERWGPYIRFLQCKLLALMETISNSLPQELFIQPGPPDNRLMQVYMTLYELLVFIEPECDPYIDARSQMPFRYLCYARQEFGKEIPGLRQRLLSYPENKLLPDETARWQDFKIKVDLSVNELACLLRIMVEHGLLMNNNRSELAGFFARFFATNNQEDISAGSLRHKMYSHSASAAGSVGNLLLGLFNTSKRLKAE